MLGFVLGDPTYIGIPQQFAAMTCEGNWVIQLSLSSSGLSRLRRSHPHANFRAKGGDVETASGLAAAGAEPQVVIVRGKPQALFYVRGVRGDN